MTHEEIKRAIKECPIQFGDQVIGIRHKDEDVHGYVLVGFDPMDKDMAYLLLNPDCGTNLWVCDIKPYTDPQRRPMTHKEVFELVGKWAFRPISMSEFIPIYSDWVTDRYVGGWQGCPISELVEPIENSPWRALEVEE